VRYRQEVFRDLENPALLEEARRFADRMGEVRAHLRQLGDMQYRYQREGWLLDAAAVYCDAVQALAGQLASAPVRSRALLAFRQYLADYVASARFTALVSDTRDQKEALGQIRYCTPSRQKTRSRPATGEDLYNRSGGWLDENDDGSLSRHLLVHDSSAGSVLLAGKAIKTLLFGQ
jgi:hypothetical protein